MKQTKKAALGAAEKRVNLIDSHIAELPSDIPADELQEALRTREETYDDFVNHEEALNHSATQAQLERWHLQGEIPSKAFTAYIKGAHKKSKIAQLKSPEGITSGNSDHMLHSAHAFSQ